MVSPSRVRLNQLNERLSNMQLQLDESSVIKKEVYEQKIRSLREKINKNANDDEAKFKLLSEQIVKIRETASTDKGLNENVNERRVKELKTVD